MAKHPPGDYGFSGGAFQPVYSNQFLVDGIWYVTVQCGKCGMTDEEVPWAEAKTPHHAGCIADARHEKCQAALDVVTMRESGLAEIKAAEELLASQIRNLESARESLKLALVMDKRSPFYEKNLQTAQQHLARHEKGLVEAQRRVRETRQHNTPE